MIDDSQFPRETSADGAFNRQQSRFRELDALLEKAPQPGDFHLYVSLACPWAHRTIIARALLGLEQRIGMTVVDPIRDERGWAFTDAPDPINGWRFLSEAYLASDPDFDDRVTVPVLWDRQRGVIANNESADILRIFDAWGDPAVALVPEPLRAEIDRVNEHVYATINNGVYRAGFAASQAAYDEAVTALFAALDELEQRLSGQRYLVASEAPTEADWRLFTTLIRFDTAYHGHFKCNRRRIVDYPSLWGYVRDLYQHPGVAATVDLDHITRHYHATHLQINPTGIVPIGPDLDLDAAHGREALQAAGSAT